MDQRLIIARLVFPTLLLTIYIYISQQLFKHALINKEAIIFYHIITALPVLSLASMPYFFWQRKNKEKIKKNEALIPYIYFIISYFSSLLMLILMRDISHFVLTFFDVSIFNYDLQEAHFILLTPIAFHFLGFTTFISGPFIKEIKLNHPETHSEFSGLKIVQLSDIHIGPQMKTKDLMKIINKVNRLQPDFIVLTGDIIDAHPELHRETIQLLNLLECKYDTLFIPGNHEYYHEIDLVKKEINHLNLVALFNETKIYEFNNKRISFSGATDPAAKIFNHSGPQLKQLSIEAQHADFRVLLIHQPNAGTKIDFSNFHIQLSGHTHAGQFIPWSLMIKLFQKYAKGLYKDSKHWIYVNQGTGFWGPRNRLGTYCEITLIIL